MKQDKQVIEYLDFFYILGIDLPIINYYDKKKHHYYSKNWKKLKNRYKISKNDDFFCASSLQFHFFNKRTIKVLHKTIYNDVEIKCSYYSSIDRYNNYIESNYKQIQEIVYRSKLSKKKKFDEMYNIVKDFFENELIPQNRIFIYSYIKDKLYRNKNFQLFNIEYTDIINEYSNNNKRDKEIEKRLKENFRIAIIDNYFTEDIIEIKKTDFDKFITENKENINSLSKSFYINNKTLQNFTFFENLKKKRKNKKRKEIALKNQIKYNKIKINDEVITQDSLDIGVVTNIKINNKSKTFTIFEKSTKRTFDITSRKNKLNIRLKNDKNPLYQVRDWKYLEYYINYGYSNRSLILTTTLGEYSIPKMYMDDLFKAEPNLFEYLGSNLSDLAYNVIFDGKNKFLLTKESKTQFENIRKSFDNKFVHFVQKTNHKTPYFLHKHKKELEQNKKETIILHHKPVSNTPIKSSKLLGTPYIPENFKYPIDKNGKAMKLLIQINFEEMPNIADFPKKGILQFYIGGQTIFDKDIKVIFHKNTDNIERHLSLSEISDVHLPIDREFIISSTNAYDYGSIVFRTNYISKNYIFSSFGDAGAKEDDMLTDFFTCSYNKMGGDIFIVNDIIPQLDPDDVLLLQLVSDIEYGDIMIADTGTMQFYIKKTDLIDRNFDNVFIEYSYY